MDKTLEVVVEQHLDSADDYRVTLSLEGLPDRQGAVRLGDLVYELQSLSVLLLGLDRAASPDHGLSTEFQVLDLKRVNPSQITIGGVPKEGAPDVRAIVFGQPFETIERLNSGATSGYDYDLLENLQQLSAPVGKRLASAALSWNGKRADLTVRLRETITKLLEPHVISHGFIQGRLESVNVHHAANVFRLFPRVGPAKLIGHFPPSLSVQVGAALGRDVIVTGQLKYRSGEPHAFAIEAEAIDIFQDPDPSFPTLLDLTGSLPFLTDDLSSEEWLAKRRAELEPVMRGLIGL
jgi:hypothetical protein